MKIINKRLEVPNSRNRLLTNFFVGKIFLWHEVIQPKRCLLFDVYKKTALLQITSTSYYLFLLCSQILTEMLFCLLAPFLFCFVPAVTHPKPHKFSVFFVVLAFMLVLQLDSVLKKVWRICLEGCNFALFRCIYYSI